MFLVLNGCKAHSAISYALYKNQLLLLLLKGIQPLVDSFYCFYMVKKAIFQELITSKPMIGFECKQFHKKA
jgi:hypothetical protein